MRAIVAGVILALSCSTLAMAQPVCTGLKGCACAAQIPPSGPIAQLTNISGNVVVARETGYSPIHATTGVGFNDQISVGGGGKARLTVAGQCDLALVGPRKIVVQHEGACACARSLMTEAATVDVGKSGADLALPADGAGNGGPGNGNGDTGGGGNNGNGNGAGPLLFGALVLGGGAAALLLTQHHASP